jgi:hypothetical protein
VPRILDQFLIFSFLMSDHNRITTSINVGGESDQSLVFLQMEREECKPPSPFKFNYGWLENEDFVKLVKAQGIHLVPPSESQQAYNFLRTSSM